MKRFLSILSAAAILLACASGCGEKEPETDPALENFRALMANGDFCAVAYYGYVDGSYEEIMAHMETLGASAAYPFLAIPEENFTALAGGEIYAVVPKDPNGSIKVYTGVMNEETFTIDPGELLAEYSGGEPILLRCNVSEIMPNVVLEITLGEMTVAYSPSLSGEDGQLVETGGVYDFSDYDAVAAGFADVTPDGAKG